VTVNLQPAGGDLASPEDFDAAIEAARPRAGMSLPQLQVKYDATADLFWRRARFWDAELKRAEDGDTPVPGSALAAYRQCAAQDRMRAAQWVQHAKDVARQRGGR
jgi:hypothetical protein